MDIVTDLDYIKEVAAEKDDENWEFRAFLKQCDMPRREIDAIVHRLVDEVTAQIDCTKCANCCQHIRPILDGNDISKFAFGLEISVSEFQEQYLNASESTPSEFTFNRLPCPFLENNLCTNYDYRPENCRSYPYLHKKDFLSRLWGVVVNYDTCPIVFNVYARLKAELWHDDDWFDEDDF